MSLVLIIIGGACAAYYFLFLNGNKDSLANLRQSFRAFNTSPDASPGQELLAFRQSYDSHLLEGLDLSQFELLPKPQSKKGFYALLVLGCFLGAVLCMLSALGARYFSSSFWLFVGACILFGFGCYFMSWVRQADDWLLEDHKRITEINQHRITERKQVVDHHIATHEAAVAAKLRSEELNNKLLREKTNKIDSEIIHSNELQARERQIPVSSFTLARTGAFEAEINLETLKASEKIKTDAEKERGENAAVLKQRERHYQITAIERTQYDKESEEILDKIGDYEEEIEKLRLDTSLEATIRETRIRKYERKIENKQEQLDGLRARLRQVNDGQETRRIDS